MFKLYNRIIFFGTVGYRMEQEFLSKALDAFSFVECWGVLMNVFVSVILSVFKRSVACPGHGFFSTSMVSRSLVHREVRFRVQKCCCRTKFLSLSPEYFMNLPLVLQACSAS